MARLRALLVVFLLSYSVATAGIIQAQAVTASPAVATAAAEDSATQVQTVESAYNLLMDRFVHPLNSAQLLAAGWDQLQKEAAAKAAIPAPAPAFDGNREADLDKLR